MLSLTILRARPWILRCALNDKSILKTRRGFLRCVLAAAAGLLLCARPMPAREPLVFGSIETKTPAGPARGWWAKIHLDQPGVRLDTTAPLAKRDGLPPGTEAVLLPVNEWAESNGATLSLNAGFFGLLLDPKPASAEYTPNCTTGAPSDIRGLSLGTRGMVSPPRMVEQRGDPALLVYGDGHARVTYARDSDLAGVTCAVAGIGATDDHRQPGTLLVEAGRNTGATARVAPNVRHPRTAAGVTADGRTLILLAIDGRQPGHSLGVTLPELADLMIELGATEAVNLDGGGSTSFYLRRADGSIVANQPSGGKWRPVANHLGLWIGEPAPATPAPK
ncbi:MAG: phosphodiester glycosidase family protein [Opitutae bacterium]|nr:phosphodiester glycosidase family protein [Opitutae bacterium]